MGGLSMRTSYIFPPLPFPHTMEVAPYHFVVDYTIRVFLGGFMVNNPYVLFTILTMVF